jgi:hypothetical protein
MIQEFEIPSSFIHAPFYKMGDTLSVMEKAEKGQPAPFFYDILYGLEASPDQEWPWETEEGATQLFKKWEELKQIPERFFNERTPEKARPYMIRLTEYFICYLFWSEGKPVLFPTSIKDAVKTCQIAPVNVSERLGFVCESPGHYHSFIQLTSLFEEARKKQALFKIKQKKNQ